MMLPAPPVHPCGADPSRSNARAVARRRRGLALKSPGQQCRRQPPNTIACGRVAGRGFLPIWRACQPPSARRAHGPTRGRPPRRARGGPVLLPSTLALTWPSLGHFQQATRSRSAAAPPRSPRPGPLSERPRRSTSRRSSGPAGSRSGRPKASLAVRALARASSCGPNPPWGSVRLRGPRAIP